MMGDVWLQGAAHGFLIGVSFCMVVTVVVDRIYGGSKCDT